MKQSSFDYCQPCSQIRESLGRVKNIQSSKATVDSSFVDCQSYTKVLVKVSGHAELIVGFVDCVEQIGHDDYNVYSSVMLHEGPGSRLRSGITCAYPNGIEG